jgi:hypothetical protein
MGKMENQRTGAGAPAAEPAETQAEIIPGQQKEEELGMKERGRVP